MKIGVILDQIDLGSIALPEFERGYVWNRGPGVDAVALPWSPSG